MLFLLWVNVFYLDCVQIGIIFYQFGEIDIWCSGGNIWYFLYVIQCFLLVSLWLIYCFDFIMWYYCQNVVIQFVFKVVYCV